MPYIPPSITAVDFVLPAGYTPPAVSAVNFVMDGDSPAPTNQVRAVCEQIYDLLGVPLVRAILDQPYALTVRLAALLDQVYGLRMLVTFSQYYGNAATLRKTLDQRYSDAAKIRRKLEQLYGNTPRYRAALNQLYNLHAGLRQALDQNYSISEGKVRAVLDQLNDLQDKDLVRQVLDMLYVIAAGEALVQRFDITVKCDGKAHTSYANINIEQDRGQYFIAGELQLYDETEYLDYKKYSSEVVLTVDGWQCHLMPEVPRETRQPGLTTYVVPLVSRTKLLDTPHSRLAAGELSGMASALVATLAAPFTVSWRLVDWFISPGRLAVNEGDAAIGVIRRIVEAVGGVIQTDPENMLVCEPEYPVSVNQWAEAEPDYHLTDQDDFFQIDGAPESRPGYNIFMVSDQQLSGDGLRMESSTIGPWEGEYQVYQVPWDERYKIALDHSGAPARVMVIDQGIKEETITSERIEVVGGAGQTAKPYYGEVFHDYNETDLGAVTVKEDGTVTTATAGNSLLYLTYVTKYWRFSVFDYTAEDVQFFPRLVLL